MKKNRLLIFVFMFFALFLFLDNTKAAVKSYNCNYKSSTEDIQITFRLRIKNSSTVAENAKFSGKDQADKGGGEKVQNWSEALKGTNFTGADYYNANTKCPDYAILTIDGAYNLYVSDEDNFYNITAAILNKHGRFKTLNLYQPQNNEVVEKPTSCLDFNKEPDLNAKEGTAAYYSCENNPYFACVWNETEDFGGYCNVDQLQYVKCGDTFDIPQQLPSLISFLVNLLKIGTPIILIFVSIITLFKAVAASKEDEIKKAQASLVKKIIAAVMVFFVISIVQFVVTLVADSADQGGLESCFKCFLNNDCSGSTYYKTNVAGTNICTYIDGTPAECGDK